MSREREWMRVWKFWKSWKFSWFPAFVWHSDVLIWCLSIIFQFILFLQIEVRTRYSLWANPAPFIRYFGYSVGESPAVDIVLAFRWSLIWINLAGRWSLIWISLAFRWSIIGNSLSGRWSLFWTALPSDDRSSEGSAVQKSDHLPAKLFPMIDHRKQFEIHLSDHLNAKTMSTAGLSPTGK